jgi:NAD(P)-dependent dehydrogenase (short-subunit alcohol dehydrogenase family)
VAACGAGRYALPDSYLVVALGRLGPEDIAAATLVLASPASSWITGVTLDIAAGKIMP